MTCSELIGLHTIYQRSPCKLYKSIGGLFFRLLSTCKKQKQGTAVVVQSKIYRFLTKTIQCLVGQTQCVSSVDLFCFEQTRNTRRRSTSTRRRSHNTYVKYRQRGLLSTTPLLKALLVCLPAPASYYQSCLPV